MEGRGRGSTMESMESSVVSSPEVLRKPESLQPKSPTSDSTEKTTYVRFLVSNAAAGSVIGKGGSTITDFQSQSGARIQLSCNHEFSPGTTDRIIMVSGAIYEILKSVELILSKLLSELDNEDENNAEPRTKVRLVVPNSSCGGIIGKGGATVRSFIEESQASIKISPQENNYYGQNDRLVTLTGTLDEQMHAIDLIVSKLAEDPHYSQSMNTPSSYQGFQGVPYTYVLPPVATAPYNGRSYRPNGNGGKFQNTKMENKLAEELYDSNGDNLDHEDGSLWDGSDDGVDQVSDLDREWQRRHDEFHTIGYRDGLMAGKETSAQEGFNVGFKQSVLVGYNWGLVRGVTSAFVALRDKVKEKLVETQDKRDEFQGLHESMYSLSTADTLRLFSEDIEAKEQGKRIEVSLHTEDLPEQSSINYNIGNYFGQLQSLILDSPAIDLQLPAHK